MKILKLPLDVILTIPRMLANIFSSGDKFLNYDQDVFVPVDQVTPNAILDATYQNDPVVLTQENR